MNILNPINQNEKMSTAKPTYGMVETHKVLKTFADHGWKPVSTQIDKARRQDYQGFQKHLIRLENSMFQNVKGLPEQHRGNLQLCLLNSHNGTTSLRLFLGYLRIACLNGIIAGTSLSDIRLVHSKNIVNRLPDAIRSIVDKAPEYIEQIKELSNREFTSEKRAEFFKRAVDARLEKVANVVLVNDRCFTPKRYHDSGADAFTTFNIAQEVIIRGGLQYTKQVTDKQTGESNLKNCTTRRLTAVSSQIKLNQYLYDQALELSA